MKNTFLALIAVLAMTNVSFADCPKLGSKNQSRGIGTGATKDAAKSGAVNQAKALSESFCKGELQLDCFGYFHNDLTRCALSDEGYAVKTKAGVTDCAKFEMGDTEMWQCNAFAKTKCSGQCVATAEVDDADLE